MVCRLTEIQQTRIKNQNQNRQRNNISHALIISKIEIQKHCRKKYPRYNVFVDGIYKLSVNEDTLIKYKLSSGTEISDENLNDIRIYDEFVYAKSLSLDFLSYRIRTEKEIRKKLVSKDISEKTIVETISYLKSIKLINDFEFAQKLIADKQKLKPSGKRILSQKLFQMGIDKVTREDVLDDYFKINDEKQLAIESINNYLRKLKDLDNFNKKKKAYSYLVRKGFQYEIINEVINQIFQ
jgi:regulatory protein